MLPSILLGGLLAGIGDIAYAIIVLHFRGKPAEWTLQSVASGLFGNAAFDGGLTTAAIGLAVHFAIATTWAAVYGLAAARVTALRRRPIGSGIFFGIFVFLFMNFIVLPLSAYPFHPKYTLPVLLKGFFFHALLVGLPIALAARFAGGPSPNPSLQRTNPG